MPCFFHAGPFPARGLGMEQAPRVRGYSSLGCQKRGSPGRLTANSSLLATPSAHLTVVKHTPSCPSHVQKDSGQGPVLPDASRSPLPAQAPARTLFCQSRFGAPPASFSAYSILFIPDPILLIPGSDPGSPIQSAVDVPFSVPSTTFWVPFRGRWDFFRHVYRTSPSCLAPA